MATTWMCENGYHGTVERRYVRRTDVGEAIFEGMYTGQCAGTCISIETGKETECECECHEHHDSDLPEGE